MTHWRKLMDPRKYIYAEDLGGREVDVQIARVVGGELTGEKNRKTKKPMLFFVGKQKPLALNITNSKAIETMLGTGEIEQWPGNWITLFPSMTQDPNGNQVPCVRIKPRPPNRKGKTPDAPEPAEPPPSEATSDAPPPDDVALANEGAVM
jgi:hypothetical protein